LVLNCVALLFSAFLTWRLTKLFGWQTFKRIGASLTVNRVYTLVLVLSIVIQLSLFFIVVAAGLWLDQIYNGAIGKMSIKPAMHKGIIALVLILIIPWLATGWIAVRREIKGPMHVFLFLSFMYLIGFSVMFISPTFRWTFVQWRFFSLMATASVLLAFVSFVFGIVCRMNFGKGLARLLNAQEELPGDDFVPAHTSYYDKDSEDAEKFDFPPSDGPIPTFSVAFGSGPEVPPPAQMKFGSGPTRSMGPRFYSSGNESFEPQPPPFNALPQLAYGYSPQQPQPPQYPQPPQQHSRSLSNGSYGAGVAVPERGLVRQGSGSSQHSMTSSESSGSNGRSKRWVIE